MYYALNQFRIGAGRGGEFEERWRNRDSFLDEVPGYVAFHLVKGPDDDEGNHLYASFTTWESKQAFTAWTESKAFAKAHAQGKTAPGVVLGPPRFQGWETVDIG